MEAVAHIVALPFCTFGIGRLSDLSEGCKNMWQQHIIFM